MTDDDGVDNSGTDEPTLADKTGKSPSAKDPLAHASGSAADDSDGALSAIARAESSRHNIAKIVGLDRTGDFGKIVGNVVDIKSRMPDFGQLAGLTSLAGTQPDFARILGAAGIASRPPDYSKLFGDAVLDKIAPDYAKIIGKLTVLDGIMPDYGKIIGGLAAVETMMPDFAKVAANLSVLEGRTPDYSKALAGLGVIDTFAFQPQHELLRAAAVLSGRSQIGFAAQAAQILSSQNSLAQLAESAVGTAANTDLYRTLGQFGLVQAHLGSMAVKPDPATMLYGATRLPSRFYDAYLDGLPARPIARRADVARFAGSTQTGLLVAESLTSLGLSDDDRDHLTDQLAAVVELQPWQTGPAAARDDLFSALAEVDADLPDWLKAAWDDISRDGVKAVSKVAHCAIECIDRTLRFLAPVNDVFDWIGIVGAKSGWLDGTPPRPTRRAKVMYVMRDRSTRDGKLAASQVESLASLVQDAAGALQAVKHSEAPTMVIMRSWVMTTEGALSQLLLHR